MEGILLQGMRQRIRAGYRRWVKDYARYARMRGFKSKTNDWPYVRRSFLECWAAPGFHRFWQIWNPGIAYFVHRLYLRLGGRRHWTMPTLGAFLGCGLAHALVAAPFAGRWPHQPVVAFACFGVLTVLSRRLAPYLRQDRWSWVFNAVLNIGLVCGSFDLGFRVDRLLR